MQRTELSTHPAGGWRELLQVAWPLMISSGSLSLMLVVDRVFLTWYSDEALAASMPAGMVYWTISSLAIGTAAYVNAFVAQYDGAGRTQRVGASLWQGVYFSLAAGVALLAVAPAAGALFAWMGHEPRVLELEADYFAVCALGSAPMVLGTALSCYYSGRGKTRTIMWVNVAGTALDVVLDPLLIFGWAGFPEWGIQGAAATNVIGHVFSAAAFAVLIARDEHAARYGVFSDWRFDRELFGRLMRFGLPQGFHIFVDVVCFSLFILLVGRLGTAALAATNLAFTLNTLAFVPLLGMGTAIMTLVGQRIGEGRPELAARTTWLGFGISTGYMLLFVAAYLLLPDAMLVAYGARKDPAEYAALRDVVVVLLRFVAVYCLFDAMCVVFGAAIRGAGDTRFALWWSAGAGLLLMVVPTFIAQQWFGGELLTAWAVATVFVCVLGLGFLARFVGGKWRSMRVIEAESAPPPDEAEPAGEAVAAGIGCDGGPSDA